MKKKIYIAPTLLVTEIQCQKLIAESMDKYNDGGGTQLTKRDNSWDIWGNDADYDDFDE